MPLEPASDTPLPYAEVVAKNLAAARVRARLSQAAVGKQMNEDLGFKAWLRSTMSLVEHNKRRLTVDELFGLSIVLRTSASRLMSPTEDDHEVALPNGKRISVADAIARVYGGVSARAGVATATGTAGQPSVKAD